MSPSELDAVVVVGRANLEKPGLSPFSPMGSGICIHPDGVVATCCHTMVHFFDTWSPYVLPKRQPDINEVIEEAERTERPFACFLSHSAWYPTAVQQEAVFYPMISFQGDREQDVAVIELGGGAGGRGLPYVEIERTDPTVGEVVWFAGFDGSDVTYDIEGNIVGWRMPQVAAQVIGCTPEGFLIDYSVQKGMSGSGVVNRKGKLVGIVVARWNSAFTADRIGIEREVGFCVSAKLLIPQLHQLREKAAARFEAGELPWGGLS